MEKLLLRDPVCLRSAKQKDCSSSQSRRKYPASREDTNPIELVKHFRGVLNRPSTTSDAVIARLPQVDINVDTDLPPSLNETINALQQLPSGKASGSDAIRAEIYKRGGPQLIDHLTVLFQKMWRKGEVPQNFKDATIVHLYKRKGNRQICDNHQGTFLLNIAGKIFARILLSRLNHHLEQGLLPDPVWPLSSSWNHLHDLCRPSTAGEVSGDADPLLPYLRGSDEGLRRGES
ncbi:hypothetical protein SprV_0401545300 [Sparganum proliferum]